MSNTENVDETKLEQDAFAEGFGGAPLPDKAVAADEQPVVEVPETAVAAVPVVEAPKFVQLTQEQFDRLQTAADKTATFESQMSKVFGTLGDVQQHVRTLQSATPAGMAVEIPKDAFADMEQDFPELAAQMRKGLEKTLKGVRGTAPTNAPVDMTHVREIAREASLARELEALEDAYPTWREIVGTVDNDGKADPNNDFRKWLSAKDQAYQARVNSTNSAVTISKAIDTYLTEKVRPAQKQPPKVAARVSRIEDAVQPRGDGGRPSPSKTHDDEFQDGFRYR